MLIAFINGMISVSHSKLTLWKMKYNNNFCGIKQLSWTAVIIMVQRWKETARLSHLGIVWKISNWVQILSKNKKGYQYFFLQQRLPIIHSWCHWNNQFMAASLNHQPTTMWSHPTPTTRHPHCKLREIFHPPYRKLEPNLNLDSCSCFFPPIL